MTRIARAVIASASLTFLLCACGGAGGGEGALASAPSPAPLPSPSPTPVPTPTPSPVPTGQIGLQNDGSFKTHGAWTDGWGTISAGADAVSISYSASDGRYTVSLPDYQEGVLSPRWESNGGWLYPRHTGSDLLLGEGPETQPVTVILDRPDALEYSYTSFGRWSGGLPMGQRDGFFAYGLPTGTADIPVTGTASYSGEVRGTTNGEPLIGGSIWVLPVGGSVDLSFDFGAGTLGGEMRPFVVAFDAIKLGAYTFRDTLYSTGSLTFSGAFIVPGSSANSSFSGSFTGPQGAELMAHWLAPFLDPATGAWGMMSGVWVAKKND